jgi:hypothetical protein
MDGNMTAWTFVRDLGLWAHALLSFVLLMLADTLMMNYKIYPSEWT